MSSLYNQVMSGPDAVGQLTEVFRRQLATERFLLPQHVIFVLRLGKQYLRSLLASEAGR